MSSSMSPSKLLHSYYKLSFRNILDIELPHDESLLQTYPSFQSFSDAILSAGDVSIMLKLLHEYERVLSPKEKLRPLLRLDHTMSTWHRVLDYGCGNGNIARYLVDSLDSVELLWGIDPDARALPEQRSGKVIRFGTSLEDFAIDRDSVDLVMVIHTLHHIPPYLQHTVLSKLAKILRPGGTMFLYEDSWSITRSLLNSDLSSYDATFENYTSARKCELFLLNDFWANEWMYGRRLATGNTWYRPLEGWIEELIKCGLRPMNAGLTGFTPSRLHGVPSAWIIAVRIA